MKVLGLCSHPVEAAATRYRLVQYVEPLAERGINLTVSPFLSRQQFGSLYQGEKFLQKAFGMWRPFLHRLAESFSIGDFDLLFVQREAMLFGPALFENLYRIIGKLPLILDLDDATYIRYVSPIFGKIGSFFKFFGKIDNLIQKADAVVCGNSFIADYVEKKGAKAVIIPTVVDTNKFYPVEKNNNPPVIGWIGTHSTFHFLESLFPILQSLATKHDFILKIIGAGRAKIELDGVRIENAKWSLEREIADFQSLDIGLYPLSASETMSHEWILGKSGFKAIQYMAVGVPFVMMPIGVCAELGEEGKTHFNAESKDEWYNALDKLLSQARLRREMGASGRKHSLEYYTVPVQADILAQVFRQVLQKD